MVTTFVQLKMKKVELRNKIDSVLNDNSVKDSAFPDLLDEYREVVRRIRDTESRLLK